MGIKLPFILKFCLTFVSTPLWLWQWSAVLCPEREFSDHSSVLTDSDIIWKHGMALRLPWKLTLASERISGQTLAKCGDAITAKSKVTVRSGRHLSTGKGRRSPWRSLESGVHSPSFIFISGEKVIQKSHLSCLYLWFSEARLVKCPEEEGWLRWDPSFPVWLMTDRRPQALWKPSFLSLCINVCRHNMRARSVTSWAERGVFPPSSLLDELKRVVSTTLLLGFQEQVKIYKHPWLASFVGNISHTLLKCSKISKMFYSSLLLAQEQVSILWTGYLSQPSAVYREGCSDKSREGKRPCSSSPHSSGPTPPPSPPVTFSRIPWPSAMSLPSDTVGR